jgi:Holliday junction resolvase-like predicted endonuclease
MDSVDVSKKEQIIKTASYYSVKNGFNIKFLHNVLSVEIGKLIQAQSNAVSILEEMIEELKKRPCEGGSD